jgi:hypothetical protein
MFAGFDDEDVRRFVREIVNRFCDKNENAEICRRFNNELDGAVVDVNSRSENDVDLIVNVPRPEDRPASAPIHLFITGDSASVVVNAAMTDGERTSEGLTVSPGSNGAATIAPIAFLVALLAAVAAFFN